MTPPRKANQNSHSKNPRTDQPTQGAVLIPSLSCRNRNLRQYTLPMNRLCGVYAPQGAQYLSKTSDLVGVDPASRPMKRLEAESGRAGQRQRPGRYELGRSQHQDNRPDAHSALSVRNEEPDVNHRGQNNRHGNADQNPQQNGHFQPPLVWVDSSTSGPFPLVRFQAKNAAKYRVASAIAAVTTNLSIFVSRCVWSSSWTEHHLFQLSGLRKATDTKVGRPTDLSVEFWPTSANSFFGLKIQRLVSHLLRTAACVRQSVFLAAIVNGQAMRRPQCFKKSSNVVACVT